MQSHQTAQQGRSGDDMSETLLYELVLHDTSWRFLQEEDARLALGWRTLRELPLHTTEDDVDDAHEDLLQNEADARTGTATRALAALQQLDPMALAELMLPRRVVTIAARAWRDLPTLYTQIAGRWRHPGAVFAIERELALLPEWQLALSHRGDSLAVWCAASPPLNHLRPTPWPHAHALLPRSPGGSLTCCCSLPATTLRAPSAGSPSAGSCPRRPLRRCPRTVATRQGATRTHTAGCSSGHLMTRCSRLPAPMGPCSCSTHAHACCTHCHRPYGQR